MELNACIHLTHTSSHRIDAHLGITYTQNTQQNTQIYTYPTFTWYNLPRTFTCQFQQPWKFLRFLLT